jgi:hypothetical protein
MAVSTENLGVILMQKGKNKDATFTPPFASTQRVRFSWDVSNIFRAPEADDERLQAELAAWDAASDEALAGLEI